HLPGAVATNTAVGHRADGDETEHAPVRREARAQLLGERAVVDQPSARLIAAVNAARSVGLDMLTSFGTVGTFPTRIFGVCTTPLDFACRSMRVPMFFAAGVVLSRTTRRGFTPGMLSAARRTIASFSQPVFSVCWLS